MSIFRKRDGPKEKRSEPSKEMQDFIRGVDLDNQLGNCNSGVNVDELRAMQTSAVYACVKILAETIASLPLHLYKKGKNGKNKFATEHPLFSCLYYYPLVRLDRGQRSA